MRTPRDRLWCRARRSPGELVAFVSGPLRGHRRVLGTRILTAWRHAVFGLVWFGDRGVGIPQLGAGFGLSRATSCRYHEEVLAVLSSQAPDLTAALERVEVEGWSQVILDGKVVDSDRCAQKTISKKGESIDAWYSGKTHDFGGNIRVVMRSDGFPIWTSEVEPGSVHGLMVACEHALGPLYAAAARGLPALADPGYEGAGHGILTPVKEPADAYQQPHDQHVAAVDAVPRRTRFGAADPTLAGTSMSPSYRARSRPSVSAYS